MIYSGNVEEGLVVVVRKEIFVWIPDENLPATSSSSD